MVVVEVVVVEVVAVEVAVVVVVEVVVEVGAAWEVPREGFATVPGPVVGELVRTTPQMRSRVED